MVLAGRSDHPDLTPDSVVVVGSPPIRALAPTRQKCGTALSWVLSGERPATQIDWTDLLGRQLDRVGRMQPHGWLLSPSWGLDLDE
jgi:hypothetical protein